MSGGRTVAAMSRRSFRSPIWHKVSGFSPRLRPGAQIERQTFRGTVWYIIKDPLTNRVHRFSAGVREVVRRMDGRNSLDAIWNEVVTALGDGAPTQDEILQLLGQLYSFDLIVGSGGIDLPEFVERSQATRRNQLMQKVQNPLFLRLPVVDPDRFLDATLHLVRPLFSRVGLLLWLAIVGWFVVQVTLNWQQLTENAADRLLAPDNVILLVLIFPILKILHELGHGYATKAFGQPVRELGVMLLIFVPTLYVDASASALIAAKWRRIVVGAAGMMVELVLAAAAMAVWLGSEPGLLRGAAFNVIVLASVSALLFNGNPLLRFDAYYMLSDYLEIPNLGTRANRWYTSLIQRVAFGLGHVTSPAASRGEAFWFAVYAPAALVYRLMMTAGIAILVASQYFIIGVLLACWTVFLSVVWPLLKGLKYVMASPQLSHDRQRAMLVTAGAIIVTVLAVFALPMPYSTVVTGTVWAPDDATVATETDGQVVEVVAQSGQQVKAGDVLLRLEDSFTIQLLAQGRMRMQELQLQRRQQEIKSVADGLILQKQIDLAADEVDQLQKRVDALVIRARNSGRYVVTTQFQLAGAELRRGDVIGVIVTDALPIVRAAIPEDSISLVRAETRRIDVRLASNVGDVISDVTELRSIPGGTRKLPNAALAQFAGGPFATDPSAKDPTSVLPVFLIDVLLPKAYPEGRLGERAFIKFVYSPEPVGLRVIRSMRQLFLSRLGI